MGSEEFTYTPKKDDAKISYAVIGIKHSAQGATYGVYSTKQLALFLSPKLQ